jgi:hypothetical protein
MFKLDLSKKNAAVSIIFTLNVVFYVSWFATAIHPWTQPMSEKIWGLFMGSNTALFLILNTEAKKDAGIADIPPDAKPLPPPEEPKP